MSESSLNHLQTARTALNECQALLADESPVWTDLHATLHKAQQAIAVAEYCSKKAMDASASTTESKSFPIHKPIAPEPVIPESIVQESETTTESEPLPAAGASLAERLSEQRLASLKNSLSINDRVRFASLLTDGDVPALLALCGTLEKLQSFEAAQVLILETAGDLDWDDEENGGVEFLALVRRLFAIE
ncbi:MAG: hypothetical protein CL828_02160 [Crocinitomicaceae bacterium]|nr:hypothetical protein [Crocinitomicaceae bacterium]